MKMKNQEKPYWEIEKGETVEFGTHFMRCYDKAGKLQFGRIITSKSNTNEKTFVVKFVIDRDELCRSKEGVSYLRGTLTEWEELFLEN